MRQMANEKCMIIAESSLRRSSQQDESGDFFLYSVRSSFLALGIGS